MNQEYYQSIGVEVKTNDKFPHLYLLNYSQIDTPKDNEDARSCRGHIVDEQGVYFCRPFDRFFNYGEQGTETSIDWDNSTVLEKLDGSLIKIWHDSYQWQIGTRGTFDADVFTAYGDITFRQLVIQTLGLESEEDFQYFAGQEFSAYNTYLFELTSPYNRVVVPHTTNKLWLLAVRNNRTGDYWSFADVKGFANELGVEVPRNYRFDTVEECVQAAHELPFNDEGYVVYDNDIGPICKIKSPAYVAVHRLRGDCMNPRCICNLVWLYEEDEYFAYFPEDIELFTPYIESRNRLVAEIDEVFARVRDITDQKEFALQVKDLPYSSILFTMRKQQANAALPVIEAQTPVYREKLLCNYMKANEK